MTNRNLIALAFLVQVVIPGTTSQARAQAKKAPYPAMAPLNQYLMPDEKSEIALARSAALTSISDGAEVMVLGRTGYSTAVKGTNGFPLYSGTIMGCRHRSSGILESQSSRSHLL
jgi:hypothetical protein